MMALYKSHLITERMIQKTESLGVYDADGNLMRNEAGIKASQDIGRVTRKDLKDGLPILEVDDNGEAILRNGNEQFKSHTPPFEVTNRIWKIVEEQRAAVDEAALMVYFAKVEGMTANKAAQLGFIQEDNPNLTNNDRKILEEISDLYAELYNEGSDLEGSGLTWKPESQAKAERFMREVIRALYVKDKVDDFTTQGRTTKEGKPEFAQQFLNDPKNRFKNVIANLERLNSRFPQGESKKGQPQKPGQRAAQQLGKTLRDIQLLDTQLVNAEFFAKRTIMSAYVPFARRGKIQVQVKAKLIKDGKVTNQFIELTESQKGMMPFFLTNSSTQADAIVEDLNERVFGDLSDGGANIKLTDVQGNNVEVKLVAVRSEALQTPPLSETVNYDLFVQTMVRLNVGMTPQQRAGVVQKLASHHSAARSNLIRTGNPGWDPDIVRGVAEHLETQTHIAGKNRHRHRVDEIMNDRNNKIWHGDFGKTGLQLLEKRVRDAKKALVRDSGATNQAKLQIAQKKLRQMQHMLLHSSAGTSFKVEQRDGSFKTMTGLGKGNQYKDVGKSLIAFYSENLNVIDSGEEQMGKLSSPLMSLTAAFQLGGAAAPAIVNLMSLATHAIPYLATYNKKTGYGGGHGMGASFMAISRASKDMGILGKGISKLGRAVDLDVIVNGTKEKPRPWKTGETRFGMNESEARFVLDMTEKGVFTPNLFNALIGTSRTGTQNNEIARFTRLWMTMFTTTEQLNRRATGLASFRLEKARLITSGLTEAEANIEAAKRAKLAVNTSQGEYAQYNRPAWARGNIFQYLFMYKQFVIITVELMRNLAPRERIIFLTALAFMSGLKGLPFGDDIADLIDTLAQMFGIKTAGIEAEIAQLADNLIPGSSPYVLRGLFDQAFETTLSTRFGQGDLFPMTGAFKSGSDVGREFVNFFGPVGSTITGVAGSAALTAKYLAETVGLREDTTRVSDILRKGFGISGLRSFTEGLIFMSDGTITNARGQVVSKQASTLDIMYRMLGFFPHSATNHNDVVRMSKQARDYGIEMKTAFIDAALKEDAAGRRRIKRDVRDFNKKARGTPFYIRNFSDSLAKALRESKRTTSGRFLRSASKAVKPLTRDLMRIYGFDHRGIPRDEP